MVVLQGCRVAADFPGAGGPPVLSGAAMPPPSRLDSLLQRFAPAWLDRALVIKVVSFGLIGCVNASIDFAVFSLLHLYFGLPIIPANLMSWGVAVTNSYVMNSTITFAAESGRRLSLKSYIAFAATQVGGLIANTITVFALSFVVPVLIAKLFAIGASFLVDFTLSHLLVFRRREGAPPRQH
jgi:putative flippase GtrA